MTDKASGPKNPAPVKSWREVLKVHPAAAEFASVPLSPAELQELSKDILANGQLVPIITWSASFDDTDSFVLDGCTQLDAMEAAGIPVLDAAGILEADISTRHIVGDDPVALVLAFNVHRRHLTSEQKRDLVGKLLKANPARSNSATAALAQTSDKTVAAVRTKLERTSEIPRFGTRLGRDGKNRRQPTPAKRSSSSTPSAKRAAPCSPAPKRSSYEDGMRWWENAATEIRCQLFRNVKAEELRAALPERGARSPTLLETYTLEAFQFALAELAKTAPIAITAKDIERDIIGRLRLVAEKAKDMELREISFSKPSRTLAADGDGIPDELLRSKVTPLRPGALARVTEEPASDSPEGGHSLH